MIMGQNVIILLIVLIIILVIVISIKETERIERSKKNMSFLESFQLTRLPILCFENNGKTVNMILDSGSTDCIIDKNCLSQFEYEPSDLKGDVVGVQSISEVGNYVFVPLKYKNRVFDIECLAIDMSKTLKEIKDTYGVTIHGVVGTDFFSKYKYILDFNEMVAYSLAKQDK